MYFNLQLSFFGSLGKQQDGSGCPAVSGQISFPEQGRLRHSFCFNKINSTNKIIYRDKDNCWSLGMASPGHFTPSSTYTHIYTNPGVTILFIPSSVLSLSINRFAEVILAG